MRARAGPHLGPGSRSGASWRASLSGCGDTRDAECDGSGDDRGGGVRESSSRTCTRRPSAREHGLRVDCPCVRACVRACVGTLSDCLPVRVLAARCLRSFFFRFGTTLAVGSVSMRCRGCAGPGASKARICASLAAHAEMKATHSSTSRRLSASSTYVRFRDSPAGGVRCRGHGWLTNRCRA